MAFSVSSFDRSFNYGDGIFTTMQVKAGQIQLWPLHLARLQYSANKLGFSVIDWASLEAEVMAAITEDSQVIKVLISRGEGGRGYSCLDVTAPNIYISQAKLPNYTVWQQQGISLGIAELKLAIQPALAGIKHTSRLEQVLVKQQLAETEFDELLVFNQLGYACEASAANVFFYQQQQWYTPCLKQAGVAGVMRQHLMQQLAVKQVNWTLPQLANVESMFICNALMEIVPVQQFLLRSLDITPVFSLIKRQLC
ncbi:aminodeoxychorismate lyase [Rheinheimera sp. MMS21-TC3]|uniref:aminodeoxychorismate lyase n=1 Tax=Rheinheimera sp. MMS21-TC3 TaxID=3072790 RepID=UPI0028C3C9D1|nr:aminodeoxychorismate lyase [Rheinheimera sp. MMS21-TC3]WNO61159.1 aminodeoxychorismate lyase [Rheinheimera sp. MMS21-TC3]